MANSPRISTLTANSMLSAFVTLGGGTLLIYTGTQPASPDVAITSQVLLATLPLASIAFGSPSAGVITFNPIGPAVAVNTGAAAWFRMVASTTFATIDGSVGTSGCDCNLNTVTITAGDTVAITSCTITQPLT